MTRIGWLGGIALALGSAGQAGAAAEKPCLTAAQMSALITYALPAALEGASKSCAAALPGNAFLRTGGSALIARYRGESAGYWPAARDAFQVMMGEEKSLASLLGDDATKQLLDSVLTGIIAQEIKPRDCATIDEAVSLIAPLPAENLGRLVSLTIAATDKGKSGGAGDKGSPFRLCPIPR